MTNFPKPVPVPDNVRKERLERKNELTSSAKRGAAIRLAIIFAELVGVFVFGSSALLMDALSSLIDVVSTVLLILFIRLAEKPPDHNHPFGHGRYEPLIGLQLGLLLVAVGGGMIFQQAFQLSTPSEEVMSPYAWIIPVGAVILLEICYHIVMYTAKKQNSPALAADAVHYRIDSVTSLFAAIALICAAYFPQWSIMIDHIGAILIAVLMIGIGLFAARNNMHQLLDRIPSPKFFNRVRRAAMRVSGVKGTEKIRIQQYGPDAHVNIDIEVEPTLSVEKAHKISQKVRVEIQKDWAAVRDVIVHIEPFYVDDH